MAVPILKTLVPRTLQYALGNFKCSVIPVRCAAGDPKFFLWREPLYPYSPEKTTKKKEDKEQIWSEAKSGRYSEYEELEGHWHFVERLLPTKLTTVRKYGEEVLPSGWKPPSEFPIGLQKGLKYFVKRTNNNMLPVYVTVEPRGPREITKVRNVQGEIWDLAKDLQKLLEAKHQKEINFMVHEFVGFIKFKGNHKEDICNYLLELGY